MVEKNSQGLSRYVPSKVREEVRRRCGFGCVVCGAAWYDYEHFNPDFKDALKHDASGITLLCMQHNQRRARGTLSLETVRRANADPFCLREGFANETFDFGMENLEVVFAGATFIDCPNLIEVNGFSIFSILPPAEEGRPFSVSGLFSDRDGLTTLKIEDNVFRVGSDNWDVECVGPRIIVRKGKGDVSLILKAEPPHRILIEEIDMEFEGAFIKGKGGRISVSPDGYQWQPFQSITISGFKVGISINTSRIGSIAELGA